MKNVKTSMAIAISILLIPWIYLVKVYSSLPKIVPIHFGGDGKPNGYGDKSTLLIGVLVISLVGLGVFFLLRNIKRIDPKKNAQNNPATFNKIAMAVVIFLTALSIIIISSTVHGSFYATTLLMPLMGIFFAFIGNIMFSLKPNHFVGIRVPWTLENDENWRKTHQIAGKVWFAGGLVLTIASLLSGQRFHQFLFFAIVAVMVLVPVIYSFTEFKKNQKYQS